MHASLGKLEDNSVAHGRFFFFWQIILLNNQDYRVFLKYPQYFHSIP